MKFLNDLRTGATIALGFLLTIGLTVLVAQTLNEFGSGDIVSASKINANFANLKSRLDSPLNVQYSADLGFADMAGSGTLTDVPNLNVTVTSSGSPIMIALTPTATGTGALQINGHGTSNGCQIRLAFLRDGAIIYRAEPRYSENALGSGASLHYTSSGFWMIDSPGAGTFTYKVQAQDLGGGCGWIRFHGMRLMAVRFHE